MDATKQINDLTGCVLNCCIKIHNKLGPGGFEKVYEEVLVYEFLKLGLKTERQLVLPVNYEELHIKNADKIDLLVEKSLVIEVKSVFPLHAVYFNQLQTYLMLLNLKHGLLVNFKVPLMKEGMHRVFNNKGRERM